MRKHSRKAEKVSFVKGGRALRSRKLECVHTDMWGPFLISSLGGSQYYLTFINDYNRKRYGSIS